MISILFGLAFATIGTYVASKIRKDGNLGALFILAGAWYTGYMLAFSDALVIL